MTYDDMIEQLIGCHPDPQVEIARRSEKAKKLALRFPDLAKCKTYREFLSRSLDEGLELDFITSSEMWTALGGGR